MHADVRMLTWQLPDYQQLPDYKPWLVDTDTPPEEHQGGIQLPDYHSYRCVSMLEEGLHVIETPAPYGKSRAYALAIPACTRCKSSSQMCFN